MVKQTNGNAKKEGSKLQNNNSNVFKIFMPNQDFPPISITGNKCELACAHCGKQYLRHMLAAETPEKLMEICLGLEKRKAKGALISGGCDAKGQVKLEKFFDAIKLVKQRTALILNIHTGLITNEQAKRLGEIGVDVVSFDMVGDAKTIRNVYGLKHTPDDFKNALQTLKNEGIHKIVPHICIGLDYGKIRGEFKAMDLISEMEPTDLVLIVLIPTKGSKMEDCAPPDISEVVQVINYAKSKLDGTNLYLGCMRPKAAKFKEYNRVLEIAAIEAGIDGIVLPSKSAVQYMQEHGFRIKEFNQCCAI